MLAAWWFVTAVIVSILLTVWVTFTLTRLDRLHARVDAAHAALDAQLVRRAAALLHVTESAAGALRPDDRRRYERLVEQALEAGRDTREGTENEVGRAVGQLAGAGPELAGTAGEELREAAARVQIARRFYNDAVRDTRALRGRRMPRLLHLAGHRELPAFFDIDDTVPELPACATAETRSDTTAVKDGS